MSDIKKNMTAALAVFALVSANAWALLYYLRADPALGYALLIGGVAFVAVYIPLMLNSQKYQQRMESVRERVRGEVTLLTPAAFVVAGSKSRGGIFVANDGIALAIVANGRVGFKSLEGDSFGGCTLDGSRFSVTDAKNGSSCSAVAENPRELLAALRSAGLIGGNEQDGE